MELSSSICLGRPYQEQAATAPSGVGVRVAALRECWEKLAGSLVDQPGMGSAWVEVALRVRAQICEVTHMQIHVCECMRARLCQHEPARPRAHTHTRTCPRTRTITVNNRGRQTP